MILWKLINWFSMEISSIVMGSGLHIVHINFLGHCKEKWKKLDLDLFPIRQIIGMRQEFPKNLQKIPSTLIKSSQIHFNFKKQQVNISSKLQIQTVHKTCQNSGLLWLVFSRIETESSIWTLRFRSWLALSHMFLLGLNVSIRTKCKCNYKHKNKKKIRINTESLCFSLHLIYIWNFIEQQALIWDRGLKWYIYFRCSDNK